MSVLSFFLLGIVIYVAIMLFIGLCSLITWATTSEKEAIKSVADVNGTITAPTAWKPKPQPPAPIKPPTPLPVQLFSGESLAAIRALSKDDREKFADPIRVKLEALHMQSRSTASNVHNLVALMIDELCKTVDEAFKDMYLRPETVSLYRVPLRRIVYAAYDAFVVYVKYTKSLKSDQLKTPAFEETTRHVMTELSTACKSIDAITKEQSLGLQRQLEIELKVLRDSSRI